MILKYLMGFMITGGLPCDFGDHRTGDDLSHKLTLLPTPLLCLLPFWASFLLSLVYSNQSDVKSVDGEFVLYGILYYSIHIAIAIHINTNLIPI